MPRLPRLHVPGGFYHVMLRGNHRESLFSVPRDRAQLDEIVASVIDRLRARVHAFCWMTNHLHFLIQIGDCPLGKVMQRIAMTYSRYRHRQLLTTGHLFERRYKAKLVDADEYFFALLRYIHLNPVDAGMVADAADYPWSSHRSYLGRDSVPWLTTDVGLRLFDEHLDRARLAYASFMAQPVFCSESGLLEDTHPDDPRVLGSDRFLATLRGRAYTPRAPLTLDQLAASICENHQVAVDVVRSPARQRHLTPVRVELAIQALQLRVANLREVAEFLGRDPSALSALLIRYPRAS